MLVQSLSQLHATLQSHCHAANFPMLGVVLKGHCRAAKFPMLGVVLWGKLRGSRPLRSGFFAFKANKWLGLQLAAVCLAIPLLEIPVYSMRVQFSTLKYAYNA